jgi:lipoate---protein ligase
MVSVRRGSAGVFHNQQIPADLAEAVVWRFAVDRPALVLGSAQREGVADTSAAAAAGVDVVRRNSGGGAVLLLPGRSLWIDVLLPRTDPRWTDDVGRSMHWLGEVWAALAEHGVTGDVHRDRLDRGDWGRLVCFSAVGPGEVTVGGRKVVGISQRRTRAGARFQCLVLDRWEPAPLLDLLLLSPAERQRGAAELHDVAAGPGVPLDALEQTVLELLR